MLRISGWIAGWVMLTVISQGQETTIAVKERQPAVAGSFYPASEQQLRAMLGLFFPAEKLKESGDPMVLVVPHAGYIFSGEVAAAAYKRLDRDKSYRHIFILAPAHRVPNQGAAIYTSGGFITPLGRVIKTKSVDEVCSVLRRVEQEVLRGAHNAHVELVDRLS